MSDRPRRPPARGGLTPEDDQLWRRVTASVSPLRRHDRARPSSPHGAPMDASPHAPAAPSASPSKKSPQKAGHKDAHTAAAKVSVRRSSERGATPDRTPQAVMDRRIRRGRVDVGARIDLHGYSQEQARDALHHFLGAARGRGVRCVLVITGKGFEDDRAQRDQPFDMFARPEPGILRRQLPVWLEQAGFRDLVSGYASAHVRHGGAGAWYVFLRKTSR